jgi:hypothetical protein
MMHRVPFVFFRAPFKQGKICDPEEIPDFGNRRTFLHFGDAQTQAPENFTGGFPFVRAEENAVALLDVEFGLQ